MSTVEKPPIVIAEPAGLSAEVRAWVLAIVAEKDRQIDELKVRVAELEAELRTARKTPQNSSMPPSTEHPHAKTAAACESAAKSDATKKRKRGGQKGHLKHERPLVPVEQCDEVVPLKPTECRGCGAKLRGDDPEPLRHQVWELPQPQPVITEYQRHRLACDCCGKSTCAAFPEGVPEHMSGPRLIAVTAVLMGLFRQSKSRTALALGSLFGVPCCAGWVVKQQQRATIALKPCYDEVQAALSQADVVHCDETPFKQGAAKAWIWTMAAATFTFFAIRLTRAAVVPLTLLGQAFAGAIVADRYVGYNAFNNRRQVCWAHLKRDFQSLIDAGGDGAIIGNRLMESLKEMFHLWHLYRAGRIRHDTMRKKIESACWSQVYHTLEDGQRCRHAPTVSLCNELFDRFDQLWLFLEIPGLEPTNNRGERSLRHAVIWRKLSFGTQSESGSRFVETLLTVIETCRQQQRHPIDFLTTAIEALAANKPAPKLIVGV
jgi:transposase